MASRNPYSAATWRSAGSAIEEGGEFISAAAEDGEDAGKVVARAVSRGQEKVDAGGEALGVARTSLDDVVEGGAGIFGVAAVGSAP